MTNTADLDGSSTQTVIFTVVTKNHFHYAVALEKNVRRYNRDAKFVIVVADLDDPTIDVGQSPRCASSPAFASASDNPMPWLAPQHCQWNDALRNLDHCRVLLAGSDVCEFPFLRLAFQYTALELTCALKSQAAGYFLRQGYSRLLYLDADVRIFSSTEKLLSELHDTGGILLTPHYFQALPSDGRFPNNIDILRCGAFNAGIIGFQDQMINAGKDQCGYDQVICGKTIEFVRWWTQCCQHQCIVDPHDGVFVDQKWLDQAPALFPETLVSRDPGINVGYWNLHERDLSLDPQTGAPKVLCKGVTSDLKAFHFSGVNRDEPGKLSRHQNRHKVARMNILANLLQDYLASLCDESAIHYQSLPYGYCQLNDGTAMQDAWREVVRLHCDLQLSPSGNPFQFYANSQAIDRLQQMVKSIGNGRFQWRLDGMHNRIATLRKRLDRQPLRRLAKLLKNAWRPAG